MKSSIQRKLTDNQAKMARAALMTYGPKLQGAEAGGAASDFLVGWGLFIGGFLTGGILWIVWIIWALWAGFFRRSNRENTAKLVKIQEQQLVAQQVQANKIAELEEKLRLAELEEKLRIQEEANAAVRDTVAQA